MRFFVKASLVALLFTLPNQSEAQVSCSFQLSNSIMEILSFDSTPFGPITGSGGVRAFVFNGPNPDPVPPLPGQCFVLQNGLFNQGAPLVVTYEGEPGTGNNAALAEIPGTPRPHNVNTSAFDNFTVGVCANQNYPNQICNVNATLSFLAASLQPPGFTTTFQAQILLIINPFPVGF